MRKITKSASIETSAKLTARDMQEFLAEIPAAAELEITVTRGDHRDPREAAYRSTRITARWDETPSTPYAASVGPRRVVPRNKAR